MCRFACNAWPLQCGVTVAQYHCAYLSLEELSRNISVCLSVYLSISVSVCLFLHISIISRRPVLPLALPVLLQLGEEEGGGTEEEVEGDPDTVQWAKNLEVQAVQAAEEGRLGDWEMPWSC